MSTFVYLTDLPSNLPFLSSYWCTIKSHFRGIKKKKEKEKEDRGEESKISRGKGKRCGLA